MKTKILFILISITILVIFYSSSLCLAASTDDNKFIEETRGKIDSEMGKLVKTIGYIIISILGLKEMILTVKSGDLKGAGSVFIKYLMIYAMLLGFGVALKWVENFIEGLKM